MVGDAGALSRAVDGVVVVARLGSLTRAVAHDSREFLATLPCRVLGVAVVGIPTESAAYRYRYYSDAAATNRRRQTRPKASLSPTPCCRLASPARRRSTELNRSCA